MEPKKIALLVGALVIAAITAVMAKNMFSQSAAPSAQATVSVPTGPEVLVATRALPVGTIIEPDSFRYQPWPKELIQNAYYLKGTAEPQALAGTVVRNAVSAGQPVTQGSLVKPGDRGFIAAALGPGMRAVSIVVSAASGVAGFAFPGDRVDLVLTQTISGSDTGTTLKTSETIVRNLRVLATDQRTTSEDEKGNRTVIVSNTVTLEVTPRIAEKIAVSQKIGDLSLSLRSIADNTAELDRAIAAGEVTVPTGTDPKNTKTALVAIASRPTDSDTTYVTGADVSRFQRRTVPSQGAPATAAAAPAGGGLVAGMMNALGIGGAQPKGPVVRVARGNNVTEVPVGGK
jgi:Flp pilus assembly protein CpaB